MRKAPPPKPSFDPEYVRDISEKVYRLRIEQEVPGNVARMLEKDREKDPNDGGAKLRNRAASYDVLTRAYLKVLGFEPPAEMTAEQAEDLSRRAT